MTAAWEQLDITANYHGGNPESQAAHESIKGSTKKLQRLRIVAFIGLIGGATCDEVEQALGIPHQTCSARISEAKALGELINSGAKRPTRSGRAAAVLQAKDTTP